MFYIDITLLGDGDKSDDARTQANNGSRGRPCPYGWHRGHPRRQRLEISAMLAYGIMIVVFDNLIETCKCFWRI